MFTFITFVTTPCDKVARTEKVTVPAKHLKTTFFDRQETVIDKIETRALTAQQAEAQALPKAKKIVRDGFGQIIEDAEITVWTIRKFAIEVDR